MTLRAIQQSYTAYGTTRQYTSGYLDTIGKESWQYGRIEMRAKLPTAQGMWPAFWLRNDVGLGELDIMEAIGGMNNKSVQTVHQSTNGGMGRLGHEDTLPSGSNADWHVYAVDREPGYMNWYVDDRLVFTATESTLSWLDPTFNSPMNIRLNLQVGGRMPAYYQKPVTGAPARRQRLRDRLRAGLPEVDQPVANAHMTYAPQRIRLRRGSETRGHCHVQADLAEGSAWLTRLSPPVSPAAAGPSRWYWSGRCCSPPSVRPSGIGPGRAGG